MSSTTIHISTIQSKKLDLSIIGTDTVSYSLNFDKSPIFIEVLVNELPRVFLVKRINFKYNNKECPIQYVETKSAKTIDFLNKIRTGEDNYNLKFGGTTNIMASNINFHVQDGSEHRVFPMNEVKNIMGE